MKVAIFGDIHGNIYGLNNILKDIEKEGPSDIYCTGDLLIPYPGAKEIWEIIKDFNIKCIRGNGEDRLIEYYKSQHSNELRTSIQYRPTQFVAKMLNFEIINDLEKLPLILKVDNQYNKIVVICHGTPYNNNKFLINPEGDLLVNNITKDFADIIIAGHSHVPHEINYNGIQFITIGSGGLSMSGQPVIHYLILEYENNRCKFHQKSLYCDYTPLIEDLIQTDFINKVAPISWLMLDELLCYKDRVYKFFIEFYPKLQPQTESEWEKTCIQFLKKMGRWNIIKKFISRI